MKFDFSRVILAAMTLTDLIDAGILTRKNIAETLDMTESMVSQIVRGIKPPSGVDVARLIILSERKLDLDGVLALYAPFMDRHRVKRGGRAKKRSKKRRTT